MLRLCHGAVLTPIGTASPKAQGHRGRGARAGGWRDMDVFWMRIAMAMSWLTASEVIYIHWPCRDFITGERCYNALFLLEILEVLWLHPCQFLRFIDISTPEESKCILGLFLASGRTSHFTEIVSRIPSDTSLGPLKPLLISTSVKNEGKIKGEDTEI